MKSLLKLSMIYVVIAMGAMATSCKDSPTPALPEFDITFTAENGTAKATVAGIEVNKAKEGDIVVVEAAPEQDYGFVRWTSSPTVAFGRATSSQTTFTMPAANVAITAKFSADLYVVNFNATPDGGTVEVEVEGAAVTSGAQVEVGADVTITATPSQCYVFAGWSGVELADDSALSATFEMPSQAVTLEAFFEKVAAILEFTASTTAGSVSVKVADQEIESGAVVEIGADVTITASPAEGYSFTEWGGIELNNKTAPTTTFEMPATDVLLTAAFTEIPTYEIVLPQITGQGIVEVRVDGEGPIQGGERFREGQTVNIKSIPAEGWMFVNIILSSVPYPVPMDNIDVGMPADDLVILSAVFEEIPSVDPPTDRPQVLKPDGSAYGTYDYPSLSANGGSLTLTASEVAGATGYRWMRAGSVVQEGPERSVIATAAGNWSVQGYNEGGDGPFSKDLNVLN